MCKANEAWAFHNFHQIHSQTAFFQKQSSYINEAFQLDGFDSHENIPPDYATATYPDKQEHPESSVRITCIASNQ